MGDHIMNLDLETKHHLPGSKPASARGMPSCRRLSRDEEHELAGLIANGDHDARNRLVQANLPLVIKIANDFRGRGLELDDLIGEGNLGLIRAAEDFDPSFGTRFSTYSAYWIKESIRRALMNTTCTIRLPAHMVGLLTKWRRAEQTLARDLGKSPTCEEVASVLGLSDTQKSLVGQARQARRFKLNKNESLETTRRAPGEYWNRGDGFEATFEADDEWRILLQRMQRLEKRECTILKLRYGLRGEEPLTLKEIGRRLGVTREWVRRIELRALHKLRDDQGEQAIDSKVGRGLPAKRQTGLPCSHRPLRSSRRSSVSTLDIPRQTAGCN
jgi:RNA polymerase primary sigma factor